MIRNGLSLLFVLLAVAAHGGSLTAQPTANNGLSASGSGLFLDLTNLTPDRTLTIDALETYALSAAGSEWTVDVYARAGSYVGAIGASDGWTKVATAHSTSGGQTPGSPRGTLALTGGLSVGAGSTVGVCLVAVAGGLRYYGTGANATPPESQTTFGNAELRLYSANATSETFGGTFYSPRTFAGRVVYSATPVPEPATIAALGIGTAAALRRRGRRK